MSTKLTNAMALGLSYNHEAKEVFHSEGKKALLSVAKAMGLKRSEFDIHNNHAGIAVSGEITLHTDNVYIQLAAPCYGSDNEILYRTCEGRKDYTGGINHFAPVYALEDVNMFATRILNLVG